MLIPDSFWIVLQATCAVALVVAVLTGCDAAEAQWRPSSPVTGTQLRQRWARFTAYLSAFLLLYAAVADRVSW